MKRSRLAAVCLLLVLNLQVIGVHAFETDQYNLPPVPLADIGDEVSDYVENEIKAAVVELNADIERAVACLERKTRGCESAGSEGRKLDFLRSPDAVANAVYQRLGEGNLTTTKIGNWMRSHKFRGQPDRYKTSYGESIFILNPITYSSVSATVRLYGVEFGIDKLDHFFQQGYQYYEIERKARAKGLSEAEARQKAIRWGQRTERTYYGTLTSGVYSNADLYANYAGMKFYQSLTKPPEPVGKIPPGTFSLDNGRWVLDPASLRETLLKPFITDHLNEALNPSAFRLTLVRSVRRAVKKNACPDWLAAYPNLAAAELISRTKALKLWDGEDYGYTKKSRTVTLAEMCLSVEENQNRQR